jgi:hypothetical protein
LLAVNIIACVSFWFLSMLLPPALCCLQLKSAGGANFALETKLSAIQKYNAARDAKRLKIVTRSQKMIGGLQYGSDLVPAKV